jgi:hypothetical protein
MSEIGRFKPTLEKPMSTQSKGLEKNFKNTANQYGVNINEVDSMLSENEFSLKKKIFSLPKMDALVFSDPKLSVVYDQMAESGADRYGYHYNETIMNIIFNDYVLNSPKYLQKYKMAIPKEKKRRDKSGINQLKIAGDEKMKKTVKNQDNTINEMDGLKSKVVFLVNEADPKNPDLFAYFPEENYDQTGKFKMAYSHIGQHSAANPQYAADSREATPEEYADLKAELEGVGYNLEILNGINESTTASSAGGAAGYVGYAGPAAWGSGDLMKTKGKSPVMSKPIWKGGRVISETNYITNTDGFEKLYNELNEQSDIDFIQKNSEAYGSLDKMNKNDLNVIKNDIKSQKIVNEDDDMKNVSDWYDKNKNMISLDGGNQNDIMEGSADNFEETKQEAQRISKEEGVAQHVNRVRNDQYVVSDWYDADKTIVSFENGRQLNEINKIEEKAKSQKQQKFMGMINAIQKGELNPKEVSPNMRKVAKEMKPSDVKDFAQTKHEELPEKVNENKEDLIDYNVPEWSLSALINGDYSGLSDEDENKLNRFVDAVVKQWGNANFMLNDIDGEDNLGFMHYNDIDNLGNNVYRLYIKPSSITEESQSIVDGSNMTMANKAQPSGEQSSNMDTGMNVGGGLSESVENLLNEINNELNAYSIYHNKLKKMSEDRKPSSLVMKDRLGLENKKNFKSDLQQSSTKEIIDVEKELQYKDQQTNVGDDPQKLGNDIEKKSIKVTDAEGDEHLKNVGNSDNDKGDEIPKRNLTNEEQDEVDMYRLGQHSLVYDNKPSERFEDRMKADMGDKIYDMRKKQMEFRAKAPLYNKDTQPVEDGIDSVQYNKEKSKWNDREGLKESMITGRYYDALNKKHIIDFNLSDVVELRENKEELNTKENQLKSFVQTHPEYYEFKDELNYVNQLKSEINNLKNNKEEDLFDLQFDGLGNMYESKTVDKKVIINESAVNAINKFNFITNGKEVYAIKKQLNKINENVQKGNNVKVNESLNKMKHLLGYNPKTFINTNGTKNNRGF